MSLSSVCLGRLHVWSPFDRHDGCITCFYVLISSIFLDWEHGHKFFDIASRYAVTSFCFAKSHRFDVIAF